MAQTDDEFEEEVLALFRLEAQEWLLQIKAALDELEKSPAPSVREKILEIIMRGLTNLGGSAATVDIPTIERLAFQVLPELSAFRAQGLPLSPGSCTSLRVGIERISDEVEKVGGSCSVSFGEEELDKAMDETRRYPDGRGGALGSVYGASPQEPGTSGWVSDDAQGEFRPRYETLRAIVEIRQKILSTPRNIADPVLQRLEAVEAQSGKQAEGQELQRVLEDLDMLDEQFLTEFRDGVSRLLQAISRLRHGDGTLVLSESTLKPVTCEIEMLQRSAGKVNASAIDLFLNGLQVFLKVLSNKTVAVAIQRLDVVQVRLEKLVPMAQQWVEVGRVEREALRYNIQS